jgi:hypothetical protein
MIIRGQDSNAAPSQNTVAGLTSTISGSWVFRPALYDFW